MHDEAEWTTQLQDFARSHDMRASILSLVEKNGERSLDPEDLCRELPSRAPATLVSYHLKVLRTAFLLPPEATGNNESVPL